jgi:tetratricopeptide (TPR) repeat protein
MRIHAAVSGESSASYAMPLNNLAYANEDLGDYAQAIALYERSLAIRSAVLPDTDPVVLRARQNLARALTGAGRLEAARAPLEAALAGMRARFGEDDANTAKVELVQADWLLRSGRVDEANDTLALLQESGARFTPLMLARRDAVAAAIARARDDPALELEKRRTAYETMREASGAMHPFVAQFALDYAEALSSQGHAAQARALVDPLQSMIDSTFATDAPIRRQLAHWR